MTTAAHLWAIGYDDTERADQVCDEIAELGWGAGKAGKYLLLEDIAGARRHCPKLSTAKHFGDKAGPRRRKSGNPVPRILPLQGRRLC
jgi:hypothetical protein